MKNKKQERYLELIDRFTGQKIAVWGDFILDEYLYGHTRRISREAPVLILSHQANSYSLGGAGNSLLNLRSLGASPLPIGVVGSDAVGRRIRAIIKKQGICADHLITATDYSTPMKTRVLAGEENTRKQQILRIDREGHVPDAPEVKSGLLSALRAVRKQVAALLISDYHYFTVKQELYRKIQPLFSKSRTHITLDSRFRLLDFPGTSVSTPNEPEMEHALQRESRDDRDWLRDTGRMLLKKTAAQAVVLTRGSKGMVLFERGRPLHSIPIHGTSDIVDVTGAGDTVISVLTLALASGATFKEASVLANAAGGIVVMKKGTATLTSEELRNAVTAK